MPEYLWGLPPIPTAIKQISEFEDDKFQILLDAVTGPSAYDRDNDRLSKLAQTLDDTEVTGTVDLLASLEFLYDRCREWEGEDGSFESSLRLMLKSTQLWERLGDDQEASFDRLQALLQKNAELERQRKHRWLRTGIFDNAVEFASFVELRPDFSVGREKIAGLVPTIILRIRTESDIGDDRAHNFQFTEDGLNKLQETIDDVKRKLSTIRDNKGLQALTIFDGNLGRKNNV